jgi:hypothetical protein
VRRQIETKLPAMSHVRLDDFLPPSWTTSTTLSPPALDRTKIPISFLAKLTPDDSYMFGHAMRRSCSRTHTAR